MICAIKFLKQLKQNEGAQATKPKLKVQMLKRCSQTFFLQLVQMIHADQHQWAMFMTMHWFPNSLQNCAAPKASTKYVPFKPFHRDAAQ